MTTEPPALRERIAGGFVLVAMGIACCVFWVGIPAGGLWLLGELTDSSTTHFLAALIGIPLAMAAYAPFLFWLNGLYLRVTGVLRRAAEDEEESGWTRRLRGPLEPMLFASFVVELIALCIWFFFLAENPPRIII
jgi:hypothetical protein